MLANKNRNIQKSAATSQQLDSCLDEDLEDDTEDDLSSQGADVVEGFYEEEDDIEQSDVINCQYEKENAIESSEEPLQELFIPLSEGLDGLCLRQACIGLLRDFLYQLHNYAHDFHVSVNVLRAMVASAFVNEVENGYPFIEELQKPLTKAQLLRLLERRRQWEMEVEDVLDPNKVVENAWDEIMRTVKGAKTSGVRQDAVPHPSRG
jgi:hypothetical protein